MDECPFNGCPYKARYILYQKIYCVMIKPFLLSSNRVFDHHHIFAEFCLIKLINCLSVLNGFPALVSLRRKQKPEILITKKSTFQNVTFFLRSVQSSHIAKRIILRVSAYRGRLKLSLQFCDCGELRRDRVDTDGQTLHMT